MRKFCFYFCLLLGCAVLTNAKETTAEEPEIVIELTGQPDKTVPAIAVWKKNEHQLSRLFNGKDRTYVLYSIDSVSSADTILTSSDGKKYFFVRYGRDDGDYRKFLFDEQERFLAVADNVETVLKINQMYGINMGVNETDFMMRFRDTVTLTTLSDFENNTEYQVYQFPFAGKTLYFVFAASQLQKVYADEAAFNEHKDMLSKKNDTWKKKQQAEAKRKANAAKKTKRRPWKALVSGGTIKDQIDLPRARGVKPIPPLKPSSVPAGTPVTKYDKNGFPIY